MLTITDMAEACHEVNRIWCRAHGDTSQPSWAEAPDWQRESCILGIQAHLTNPVLTPQASHDLWVTHKLVEGWTYGPVKDPEKKEHPCMVPYDQLPKEQRAKDVLFGATIRMLLDAEHMA